MQCLANRSSQNLIKLSNYATGLTISKAKEGSSLRSLKNQNVTLAVKSVSDAILWLQESLNINSPMKDTQIVDASITLINKYYWLKFEEIILILGRIKTGQTGKLYHAFDVQVFCSIIEDYLSSEEVAEYHEKENQKHKKAEKENYKMSEESRTRFQKIYESIINEVPKEQEEKDENGKPILIRYTDYYNGLKELLPEMTDEEMLKLKKEYVRMNYKDGIQLIEKALKK